MLSNEMPYKGATPSSARLVGVGATIMLIGPLPGIK